MSPVQMKKCLLALLVSLVVGALIGLLNGAGITFLKISPFVMTLGMSGVVTGIVIILQPWQCQRQSCPDHDPPDCSTIIAEHPDPERASSSG